MQHHKTFWSNLLFQPADLSAFVWRRFQLKPIFCLAEYKTRWSQALASELESDLQDTVDWGKKWHVDFNAGKTRLVLLDQSNNTGAIDVKIFGPALEKKSSFKMLALTFSSKLETLTLSLLLKLSPRKLEHWFFLC